MKRHLNHPVLLAGACVLGFGLTYWMGKNVLSGSLGDSMSSHAQQTSTATLIAGVPDEEICALSTTPCHTTSAQLELDTDIVRPMAPANLSVTWPKLDNDIKELIVELEGHEMMMGVYKAKLTRESDSPLFRGELMLPFCVSDAMTWKGRIIPTTINNDYQPQYISVRMKQ
ncbi:hypothetical protein ACUYOF_19605 [Photobacterium ganghwense]|uniref:hypothetical protein n=1 Tax=Photobacterium ganghwense TaxID=320778 RepID=UPI0040576433